MKLFGALLLVLGMSAAAIATFGMAPMAPAPATKPAATTSQPAMPACCGDACMKMGAGCCKADDKGKVTCSMGGSCCVKPSTAPATSMPGMGGMGK